MQAQGAEGAGAEGATHKPRGATGRNIRAGQGGATRGEKFACRCVSWFCPKKMYVPCVGAGFSGSSLDATPTAPTIQPNALIRLAWMGACALVCVWRRAAVAVNLALHPDEAGWGRAHWSVGFLSDVSSHRQPVIGNSAISEQKVSSTNRLGDRPVCGWHLLAAPIDAPRLSP
jgi:hypothetical protein